jgi:PGF-CTERM protein
MSRALALVLVGLLVVGTAAPAAADPSLSVSDVSIPDSVTQGDSFSLTVTLSGDDLQGDRADVGLSLPDGLSCSPGGTQTVTLNGGTGSATFDCTADAEGDYAGEVTVSASATPKNGGSDRTASTQTGLQVISPASLTLSTSLSPDTVDAGNTATLTALVHNAGDASTTYQFTAPSGSGYSVSVASGSESGTVTGGATDTVEYTVTGDSAGDYTLSTALSAGNGQSLSEDQALTVQSTSSSTPTPTATPTSTPTDSGSSGGGGGGGGASVADTSDTSTATAVPGATATPVVDDTTADDEPTVSTTATPTAPTVTGTPAVDTPTVDTATPAVSATVTATATPQTTPTETPTAAPTDTPVSTDAPAPATESDGQPGFGIAAALVALGGFLLARRR